MRSIILFLNPLNISGPLNKIEDYSKISQNTTTKAKEVGTWGPLEFKTNFYRIIGAWLKAGHGGFVDVSSGASSTPSVPGRYSEEKFRVPFDVDGF
jgi:hypothetical protein